MAVIAQPGERQTFSWFVFGIMASVTFVGILSELLPSGVLPQMAEGLGISDTEVGFLVGVYALASAIFAIPLVSATLVVNRKTLLMMSLIGFAASNIVVALSSSNAVIIASRVLGGLCAGVMWPMIAAYGTTLVPEEMRGISMGVFLLFGGTLLVSHAAFFLWGLAFGPLVTVYQTAVIKRLGDAKDVATSVQSSVFNFSVLVGSWRFIQILAVTDSVQYPAGLQRFYLVLQIESLAGFRPTHDSPRTVCARLEGLSFSFPRHET